MRAKIVRTIQGVLAFGALVVLTGAKGDCGGLVDGDGDDDGQGGSTPIECEPGSHLETKCDEYGIICWDECVPDELCPDGTVLDYVCDPLEPTDCMDPNQPDCGGGGGQCYPVCVPVDPCGQGYHEEWVCDPGIPENCDQPPPGCYPICVPDNNCGPGMHEEWVCDQDMDPNNPDPCYPICVPDPICGPGFHEEIVCNEPDPMQPQDDPMLPPGECIVTCVPDSVCEPGYHEEIVCEPDPNDPMNGNMGEVCYTTCVPDQPECPPDTVPVQVCQEDGMGGFYCWIECTPIGCPDGTEPVLVCEQTDMGEVCWEECQPLLQPME